MKLKIFKFYPDAIIPQYQTKGAAGFDFCAHLDRPYVMKPGEIHAFDTGVGVEIPKGYELQIRSRSGLAYKYQVSLLNGIGTIDSDYRGEMRMLLKNHSDKEFTVEDLAKLLVENYQIDENTPLSEEVALRDAAAVSQTWIEAGIAEA